MAIDGVNKKEKESSEYLEGVRRLNDSLSKTMKGGNQQEATRLTLELVRSVEDLNSLIESASSSFERNLLRSERDSKQQLLKRLVDSERSLASLSNSFHKASKENNRSLVEEIRTSYLREKDSLDKLVVSTQKEIRVSESLLSSFKNLGKEVVVKTSQTSREILAQSINSSLGAVGVINRILKDNFGVPMISEIVTGLVPSVFRSIFPSKKEIPDSRGVDLDSVDSTRSSDRDIESTKRAEQKVENVSVTSPDILSVLNTIEDDLVNIYSDSYDKLDLIYDGLVSLYSDSVDRLDRIDDDLVTIYASGTELERKTPELVVPESPSFLKGEVPLQNAEQPAPPAPGLVQPEENRSVLLPLPIPLGKTTTPTTDKTGRPALGQDVKLIGGKVDPTEKGMNTIGGALGSGFLYLGGLIGGTKDKGKTESGGDYLTRMKNMLIGAGIGVALTWLMNSGILEKAGAFLNDKVLPFLEKAKDWISGTLIPFFTDKILPKIIAVKDFFMNEIVPRVLGFYKGVYGIFKDYVIPFASTVWDGIKNGVLTVVDVVEKFIVNPIKGAFRFAEKIFINICDFTKKYLISPLKSVVKGIASVVGNIVSFFREKLLGGILNFLEKIPFVGDKIRDLRSTAVDKDSGVIDVSELGEGEADDLGAPSAVADEVDTTADISSGARSLFGSFDLGASLEKIGTPAPVIDKEEDKSSSVPTTTTKVATVTETERSSYGGIAEYGEEKEEISRPSDYPTVPDRSRYQDIVSALQAVIPDLVAALGSGGTNQVSLSSDYQFSVDTLAVNAVRG